MSTGKVYKQAIRRVFAKKYQDELMAVYWGREDDAIHVITTLRHYVHKIASANEDTLEFVSSVGDSVTVKVVRGTQQLSVSVKLGELQAAQ